MSSQPSSDHRWAVQLGLATLVICVVTGALFYFTTRDVFGRTNAQSGPPIDPKRNVVSLEHGLQVFAANCAMCHGPTGLGDGQAAAALPVKARNFTNGWFKIGTTRTGLPTDDDIAATIRRGMLPGPMPPWPQLVDGEIRSVAMAVRHLAIEGRADGRLKRDKKLTREQALADAHSQLDPGPIIVLPLRPAQFDLARGKTFYLANCAVCHDPDGRGKLREDLVDNDENPITARDFTTGQFKGGNNLEDIAMRISRGIPGSPMPANVEISPADLWNTAAFVQTFFRASTAEK